jgi:hypothetical protein
MAIVPRPLPASAEARALLHHLLEHGDTVGRDAADRSVIQLLVSDYVLEALMTFDADTAELEPEPPTVGGPRGLPPGRGQSRPSLRCIS